MAAQKEYRIVINGLTESINAVDALNKQLDALDKKISALQGKAINVGAKASASSGGGSKSSALTEEAKLEQQIQKIDEKRVAYSKEIYQNYLAAKDVLKETENDQKSIAATERLQANSYSNTISGMKAQLADIKSAMQTVDLGDTDQLDKMTQRANELNNSLKKIEESYGQFGRNVGNYANGVAEGLQKVKIEVGGTVREFDNAKQAAKTLGNELKTMAVNGQQGTKEFKDLQKAVASLNSDIKDATVSSKAMDNLLDTMQSFAAIGSVTQGFSALFGFDDTEIEKSIQKLVALQNVMQGIEKINQQMNSAEGIGGWLAKGNAAIDSFVESLTSANKAQEALNTSTIAGKTASEGLAAAETAQATATAGATVATKALGVALKALGIGLVISAIAALITYWDEIYDYFVETVPALKNLSTWFDKIRAVAVGVGTVVLNYLIQPFAMLAKTIQALISGNFSEIPKIIADGYKNAYSVVGNFQKGYNKEIERQQKVHNEKMREEQKKANDEQLKDEEAKYGTSHKRTQEYLKKQMALTKEGSDEYKDLQRRLWEDERKEREENNRKKVSETKKNNRELLDAEKDLVSLKIANMKEGLNKTLKQLEEERKQKLAKVVADGILVAERQKEINEYYDRKILDEKRKWAEEIEDVYENMWDKVYAYSLETTNKISNLVPISTEIDRQNLENKRSAISSTESSVASYGIQGANQLSKGTQQLLTIEKVSDKYLSDIYKDRIKIIEEYWNKRIDFETKAATLDYKAKLALENENYQKELRDAQKQSEEIAKIYQKAYDEEKITMEEHSKILQENAKQFNRRYNIIEKQHEQNIVKLEQDKVNKLQQVNGEYFREELQELRDFQTAISNLESKQPVYNVWGITNFKKTNENNRNLLASYEELANKIIGIKDELQRKLNAKEITFIDYQQAERELDTFVENVGQKMDKIKSEMYWGNEIARFIQDAQMYIQEALNSFNTIMNAVWDAEDVAFDKEQEEIDKWNDALDKALDKQQEIIEEHKSKIDSIEDELANSRGDRRQHLIDQINAEIEAQRAAEKEEQRIQKEKEAAQKKQDALDLKRKKADYDRQILQAIVNGAQAVTMAAINTWPIPAIPLMALAGATTAAQVAIMKANKPYRVGGQLEGGLVKGKRHTQGGVPVGNTGIEVEGDEMIIRRESTIPNIDLLNFINKSQRKIDINDLIDFYSSGKIKKNIQSMSPKTKYADGGALPSLSYNYDINDRLITSFEQYANKPTVVQVVDIINRTEAVKNVQVLAGLSE